MDDDDYWFLPKRYGYGAGLPVVWQGWVLLGIYIGAVIAAGLWFMPQSPGTFAALFLVATVVLCVVAASKTRRGWQWRWGEDD